jgi:hypothetical protein
VSPTVSVVIMADRRREAFVAELLAKLDRPAEVVWDQREDRWDTGRRAMLAYSGDTSHHLVLQDDAVIPHDLVAGVERALGHVPDGSPLALYCGRVRPFREMITALVTAAGDDASWLTMGQIHWGVGIVMPTGLIRRMVAWCDRRSDIANYDRRISRWCQHQGLTVYYPWPSLVDHRDSPSLVAGRGSAGRRAHRFLGANRSALDCDWTGRVVSVPKLDPDLPPDQIAPGSWRVIGAAAHASVVTTAGRAAQLHFKGAVLSGVPLVEVRHLLSVGLIEPVPNPQPTTVEVTA